MSNTDIVRAWKDPEYRSTLNYMPTHPAGQIELADPDLIGSAARVRGFGPVRAASVPALSCGGPVTCTKHCR
jgi:mersacidin/lichenicidin family type 2 lantibiotic